MVQSCDNWCYFHLSVARSGDAFDYRHRVITAERTPRRGRALICHSIKLRSIYEIPDYVAEDTLVSNASECEHRKTVMATGAGTPAIHRLFVEIKQTLNSRVERFGFAIPDDSGGSYEASCPLNPFPSDADVLCYIASHRDLINALGADPKAGRTHYQKHGRREGRTTTFEPLRYVASHPDLFVFGTDKAEACKHFIRHGHREARPIMFDPMTYLAGYQDLLEAIPPDEEKIVDHYIKFGYAEGRHCDAFPWRDYFRLNPDLLGEIEYNQHAAAEHFVLKGYRDKRQIV